MFTIHPGMYCNVDDVSSLVGSDGKKEVRAVQRPQAPALLPTSETDGPVPITKLTVYFTVLGSSSLFQAPSVTRITLKAHDWRGPAGQSARG